MPLIEHAGRMRFGAVATEYASMSATYIVSREEDANGNFICYAITDGKGAVQATFVNEDEGNDAIQWAVDHLPAKGGTIFLKAGTYIATGTFSDPAPAIKITTNNVRLVGEGWASVIKVADGTTKEDEGINLLAIDADNIVLENFQIYGNYENNTPISSTSDGYNIHTSAKNKLVVRNVLSQHGTGDGIEILGSDVIVDSCQFIENYEQGVHVHASKDVVVSNNLFKRCVNDGSMHVWNGASDSWTERLVVSDNTFEDDSEEAIRMVTDNNLRDITVSGNVIKNPGASGIGIDTAQKIENLHIFGNTVERAGSSGVRIRGNGSNWKIEDNLVRLSQTHGFAFVGWNAALNGLFVHGNSAVDNNQQDGINRGFSFENNDFDWENVHVWGNQAISTATPYHDYGFLVASAGTGTYTDAYFWNNKTKLIKSNFQYYGKIITLGENCAPGPLRQRWSGNFAIDSTGTKTISLGYTRFGDDSKTVDPNLEDIQLSIAEVDDVDDWNYGFVKVVGIFAGAPRIDVMVNVTSASATSGAQAKVVMWIDSTVQITA